MRTSVLYPVVGGILMFLIFTMMDALHVADHSSLRAATVGCLTMAITYWIAPKFRNDTNR